MSKVSQLIPKELPEQKTSEAVRFVLGGKGKQTNKTQNAEPATNLVSIYSNAVENKTVKDGDTGHIPIDQLDAKPQHREDFNQKEIDALAANIDELGLIQPLVVRYITETGRFEIVSGERRYRASKQLGLTEVPCVIREADEGKKSALQLAENIMRKDLNPIEEARGFRDVMDKNSWSVEEAANYFGRNKRTVYRSLSLLELPQEVQNKVAAGVITPKAAREIGLAPSNSEKQQLAATVATKSLTAEQTKELVQKRVGKPNKSKPKTTALTYATELGSIGIKVPTGSTYDHVLKLLEQAAEEMKTRRDNRVSL